MTDTATAGPRAAEPAVTAPSWRTPGPRWHHERHAIWQLVLGVVGYVIAQTLSIVATISVNIAAGALPPGAAARGESGPGWPGGFAGMLVLAAVGAASFWLVVRFIGRRRPAELLGPRWWLELLAGLGIGTLLFSLVVAVLAITGAYRITAVGLHPGILVGLGLGIGAGFAEEVLFRGFLLRLINRWAGTWIALGVTSIFFGVAHLANPGATLFGAAAIAVEAGVMLGAAYLVTGRLWLAIGIHLAWNAVQGGIFSLSVSGTGRLDGLFTSTVSGPDWLTGGAMGPEASVPALLLATVVGVAMVVWAHRNGRFTGRLAGRAPVEVSEAPRPR